jgi:hypothetical protein
MNEEQMRTLSLKAAYAFGATHGLKDEVSEIRDLVIEWEFSYTSSLRRGYIVALFEKHGIFEEFKTTYWAFGNTSTGETERRRYLRIKRQYEAWMDGIGPEPAGEGGAEGSSDPEEALEFALEAHLRDFLARNLDRIEVGLRLYTSDDRNGIEFPVEGGRIDLLAVDRAEKYVVIELKLSQGRSKTLGQLLYYMGWVDQHMGQAPCRGFIIANEITDDLSVAVSRVPGVSLARYRMSFAIEAVGAVQQIAADEPPVAPLAT